MAAGLRAKVKPFLDEGRLHRTVRLIQKADDLCPALAHETWAALVMTLAELGRYTEARAVAAKIDAAADAPADAKAAAVSDRERCDNLDKAFAETDEAKAAMRDTRRT